MSALFAVEATELSSSVSVLVVVDTLELRLYRVIRSENAGDRAAPGRDEEEDVAVVGCVDDGTGCGWKFAGGYDG